VEGKKNVAKKQKKEPEATRSTSPRVKTKTSENFLNPLTPTSPSKRNQNQKPKPQ
jgi:hypothetical protein